MSASNPPLKAENPNMFTYCQDPTKYTLSAVEKKRFDKFCDVLDAHKRKTDKQAEDDAKRNRTNDKKRQDKGSEIVKGLLSMETLEALLMSFGDEVILGQFITEMALETLATKQLFWQTHGTQIFKDASLYMKKFGKPALMNLTKPYTMLQRQLPGNVRFMANLSVQSRAMTVATSKAISGGVAIPRWGTRAFLWIMGSKYFAASMLTATRIAGVLSKVMIAQMLMQLVGMVVDMIDPCALQKEMNADVIKMMGSAMDEAFKQMVLPIQSYVLSLDKEPMYTNDWPIDARVEEMFPTDIRNIEVLAAQQEMFGLSDARMQEFENERLRLTMLYKMNQKYNYRGEPLRLPPAQDMTEDAPDDLMVRLGDRFLAQFSNNNVIVERWYNRYSPLIYIGIVILLFLVFKYV
jgi:hypothetical protein